MTWYMSGFEFMCTCVCVEGYCDIPSIAFNSDFPLDLRSSFGSMSMEQEYCCSSSKVVAASKALSKYASTWDGRMGEGVNDYMAEESS